MYCRKCDKMVKSTAKKNYWFMYDHVFLLTRRIVLILIMVGLFLGGSACAANIEVNDGLIAPTVICYFFLLVCIALLFRLSCGIK